MVAWWLEGGRVSNGGVLGSRELTLWWWLASSKLGSRGYGCSSASNVEVPMTRYMRDVVMEVGSWVKLA